jgi:hypothetical protein
LAQGTGLTAILAAAADDADQLGAQLAATEEQLRNLPAHHNAPQAYLHEVHDILMHPENFIRLNHIELTLTRMCIKVNGETSEPSNTIQLNQIEIPGVLKRVIALVHYPRSEMLTAEEGR